MFCMNTLTQIPFDPNSPTHCYQMLMGRVTAGFPSPAADWLDEPLNVVDYLIEHPSSTFFMSYTGKPIQKVMVNTGDILVVDKSVLPRTGTLVVLCQEGEMKLRLWQGDENATLETEDWYVWGSVIGLARKLVK